MLGFIIAIAGVCTAKATEGDGVDPGTQAEVTADAELDIDAAFDDELDSARADVGDDLSVDPTGDANYATDRPQWVDEAPTPDGKPTVWPVKSLLCDSPAKARESLEIQVQGAMAAYAELALEELVGDQSMVEATADNLIGTKLLAVDLDSDSLERYAGTVQIAGETRYEEAVLLTFDQKFDRRLVRAWKEQQVQGRLNGLGVVAGVGFSLLVAGTGLVRRIARRHQAA